MEATEAIDYEGTYEVEDNGDGTALLTVEVVWIDDDGDDCEDAEFCNEPKGWDGTEPAEYERLERIVCERNGLAFDPDKFDLRGGAR